MSQHIFKTFATIAAAAILALPLVAADAGPVLPKPTGKYSVGRVTYYLMDPSRDDERGTQKDHKREFPIQVWYPARSGSKGKPAAWLLPEWASFKENNYSGELKKSPDVLQMSPEPSEEGVQKYLASIVVHAQENVPVASSRKPFPVILLAPGSVSFPSKYTSLAEDLASHGFIVVGDVPVGNGVMVPFPAGNVTPGYRGAMFDLWAGDLSYEIDQLKVWNETKGHLFYGRVDLNRIGAFGHSAGGNVLANLPNTDKRLKAIALLDSGGRAENAPSIPVLILRSEEPGLARHPDILKERAKERKEYLRKAKPGILMKLLGAEHAAVTDRSAIPALGGPGDGKAYIDTTRAVLREFFGQYLLGKHSELLVKGAAKYPLLQIESPYGYADHLIEAQPATKAPPPSPHVDDRSEDQQLENVRGQQRTIGMPGGGHSLFSNRKSTVAGASNPSSSLMRAAAALAPFAG